MKINRRLFLLFGIILLVLSFVGLIIVTALYIVSMNITDMYAIVLDAGSTSTKLNLYRWRDEPFRSNGQVVLIESVRQKPGISNYIAEPTKAYQAMEPNLKQLITKIPADKRTSTPIYLAATAGMRLKLLEDPLGSMDLFEVLRRGLLKSGLEVEVPNERIRMLSGSEEGLYGWVSVNSILDKITHKHQASPQQTVGSLDLGGASTQIAFVSKSAVSGNLATSVMFSPLKLFGAKYEVYSHSFLCYGKNEFEKRTMGFVVGTSMAANIQNPCFPTGYTIDEDATSLFSGPCMSGSYALKTFGSELKKPTALNNFKFTGTGDVNACKAKIESQFRTGTCTNAPCSFNNIHQPEVSGLFRAYSGFSFVMKFLFPNKFTGFTKIEVETAVRNFCAKPWSEIAAVIPPADHAYAALYCFDGLYVVSLLTNYGFKTDEQWKSITFGTKINGDTVSWALGYMLDQSGYLPTESPKIDMSLTLFVSLFIIILLVIGTAIACIVIAYLRREKSPDSSAL